MSMLSDFVQAITKETRTFMSSYNGTVILDTEIKGDDFSANFPLVILGFDSAGESGRLPGIGATRMDWDFSLRVYAFEPNAYNSDDGGSSAQLLTVIDDIRVHFENEVWMIQEMVDLTTNYGFRCTYQGTNPAEPMTTNEGICMGYKHSFASIAIDLNTNANTDNVNTGAGTNAGTVVFE